MNLRIMTYNIQSGRDVFKNIRLNGACEVIEKYAPDIVGLNEVRMGTSDLGGIRQAEFMAERLHMHYAFAKAIDYLGGEYGVALLSRFPIESFKALPVPQLPENEREARYEDRVLLKAGISPFGKRISVYVSHFGLSVRERENAAALTLSELSKEKDPAIFMGDLNMTPEDPLIKRISAFIPDAFGSKAPFTYASNDLNQKIDYIFADPRFRVENAFAPHSLASDHIPLLCDLTI